MPQHVEYLVIGGGPGGTPTAMALARHLMGEAALMIQAGLPLAASAATLHPHPTLTESFALALNSQGTTFHR